MRLAGSYSMKAEDILPKILPPNTFEKDGEKWLQKVSTKPATRLDVIRLKDNLDKKLEQQDAKITGICPIRRELYTQAFDEILRQVTVNCAERGILLLRARNEINATFQAYHTVYESSIGFGCRQVLHVRMTIFKM
jgi:dynein light intermediate chain